MNYDKHTSATKVICAGVPILHNTPTLTVGSRFFMILFGVRLSVFCHYLYLTVTVMISNRL